MQATDTATDRDFVRRAATVARWTGKALWAVLCSAARITYALLAGVAVFIFEVANHSEKNKAKPLADLNDEYLCGGPGPAPGSPGHNNVQWYNYWDK